MKPWIGEVVGRVRSRIPVWLLPLVAGIRFVVAWTRPTVRRDARAQMRFLLESARPDADIESAARAYVRRQIWRGELRWHPERITGQRVVGLEHLHAARELGRGVVLSFMHHGQIGGAFPSVSRHAGRLHMVTHPRVLQDDAPAWVKQHMRAGCSGGDLIVRSDIGSAAMKELLRQGVVLGIASDVPGSSPVTFAGRELIGSSGAARMAEETKAPVVVMTSELDSRGPLLRLHTPLHADDHESPQHLLAEMLAIHETYVLRFPELTDIPLSRWGIPDAGGEQ
jgi:lauroyl/myristoyl acyltransferase